MQEGWLILVDVDAAAQQTHVQDTRSQTRNRNVDLALQQQAHAHTTCGGLLQGQTQLACGIEIGRDDVDFMPRSLNGLNGGSLDGATLPQVVSHHERTAHRMRIAGGFDEGRLLVRR